MTNTERLLTPFGLSFKEFFSTDTLALYGELDKKPFGTLTFKNGKVTLRVGNDVENHGLPIRINNETRRH